MQLLKDHYWYDYKASIKKNVLNVTKGKGGEQATGENIQFLSSKSSTKACRCAFSVPFKEGHQFKAYPKQ